MMVRFLVGHYFIDRYVRIGTIQWELRCKRINTLEHLMERQNVVTET